MPGSDARCRPWNRQPTGTPQPRGARFEKGAAARPCRPLPTFLCGINVADERSAAACTRLVYVQHPCGRVTVVITAASLHTEQAAPVAEGGVPQDALHDLPRHMLTAHV